MTVKLFENDSLLKECEARVLSCTPQADKFFIELDRTVFFPEGGGQLSDRGKIVLEDSMPLPTSRLAEAEEISARESAGANSQEIAVLHVSEKEGRIWHECAAALPVGVRVRAVLDWAVRLDRMQQHLGEHLLSYACWKLFQANNVGFHMNEESVFIDLDKELGEEELLKAELFTNEIIWEDRPVKISYLDAAEAAKLAQSMRKFNSKLTGILRIVSVEGADICTCCGTHPVSTGMLGSVKVIRHEKHKGGCRVEFLCGRRALMDADKKNAILLKVAASMSAKPELVPEFVAKQKADLEAQLEALRAQLIAASEKELAKLLASAPASSAGAKVVAWPLDGFDAKDLRTFIPKITCLENTLGILVAAAHGRLAYAVCRSADAAIDCRAVMKELNAAFGGRGGGKSDCAQGGADFREDWQEVLAALAEKVAAC